MEKIVLICLTVFLLAGCATFANQKEKDINILTLMSSTSKSKDRLWIGTFQLVFNDMKNNIIKHDIKFVGEKPTADLKGLNREEFTSDMLDISSYYKSYGKTSIEEKNKIKQALIEKFNTKSDIIDTLDWSEGDGKYYAYAMIKKDFEFLNEFDKLEKSSFNNSIGKYDFFGIGNNSSKNLYNNLNILFYKGKDNYAIELLTKTGEKIYLYRTNSNKSFKKIYEKMEEEKNNYKENAAFRSSDTLRIPNLNFEKIRNYKELCNKTIEGTNLYFSDALETIKLELNNKGGKVKSEAVIMTKLTAIPTIKKTEPRHFNFDKTFVMFLVDKDKKDPYLALQVHDLNIFTK